LEAAIRRRKAPDEAQRSKETWMTPNIEELLVQFGETYGTMVVRIWRPAASRGTVFCIHGFEGNGGDFDYLAEHLLQQNFTVICPDLIGRGRSTFFGDTSKYSFDAYLVCIGALSKYASDKNYFLGTSWGGAILLFFLYATRVKAEKLILNDVGLRGGPAIDNLLGLLRQDSAQEFDTQEEAYAHVRSTRSYLGEFSETLWPNYLREKIRFADGKYRLAYDPMAIPEVKERRYDLFPILEKIDTEILLLFGEESEVYDAEAVANLLNHRRNIGSISGIKAGHPPSLMTYEQALLISGYLAS
jgi:pimeloyl-ACP methyl ester carboxylesterase